MAAFGLGLLLGIQHALDPDHLIAVSTIVSEHRNFKWASLIGAFWGLGHTTTFVHRGFDRYRPACDHSSPTGLGARASGRGDAGYPGLKCASKVFRSGTSSSTHSQPQSGNSYALSRARESRPRSCPSSSVQSDAPAVHRRHVHGLASNAALMLLMLSTIESPVGGLVYIVIFGLGSVGGMLLLSGIISLPFILTAQRFTVMNRWIRVSRASLV